MVNDSTDYRRMMFRLQVLCEQNHSQTQMANRYACKISKKLFFFVINWLPNVKSIIYSKSDRTESRFAHLSFSRKKKKRFFLFFLFCFSHQKNQIRLFVFWENLRGANPALGFIWPLVQWPNVYKNAKKIYLDILDMLKRRPYWAFIVCEWYPTKATKYHGNATHR